MLALANMVHFVADELPCLCAGRFSFSFVFLSAFQGLFVWHQNSFHADVPAWTSAIYRSKTGASHVASLVRDLRLWRNGSRLGQRASTATLVPRSLSLPQREAPPLWESPRAATGVQQEAV